MTPHPFAALVRRLDAEASKAPWEIGKTYETETDLDERGYHLACIGQYDGPMLYRSTEFTAPGAVREPGVMRTNADLVVTLRNAAPEVAALVEAAGAVVKDALRDPDTEYQMWVGEHLIDALRAALDALRVVATQEVDS